jgi:hypothetical protein
MKKKKKREGRGAVDQFSHPSIREEMRGTVYR